MLTRALVIALVVLGASRVADAQPVLTPWRPPTGCTSGQVIQFNGVAWVCATPVVFSTNNVIPKGNGTGLTASGFSDDGTYLYGAETVWGKWSANSNGGIAFAGGTAAGSDTTAGNTGFDFGMTTNDVQWRAKLATSGHLVGYVGAGTNTGGTNQWLSVDGTGNTTLYGNTTLGDAIGDSTTIHGATTTVGADANAGATTALIVKNPSNAASTTTDIALQDGSGDLWRVSANNVTGVTAVTGDTDFNGTIRLLSGNPTTTNRIDVVNSSHINTTGNDPALSSCGSSPSIIGADLAGTVTVGTGGPTSCTVTFDNAYITNPPACVVTSRINTAEPLYISSISTTAFTVTTNAGTDLSSGKFNYVCIGVP